MLPFGLALTPPGCFVTLLTTKELPFPAVFGDGDLLFFLLRLPPFASLSEVTSLFLLDLPKPQENFPGEREGDGGALEVGGGW